MRGSDLWSLLRMVDEGDELVDSGAGADGGDVELSESTTLPLADIAGEDTASRRKTILRVVVRVVVVVAVLVVAGFALASIFDDLDGDAVTDALGRLSDAEWLSLGFGWLIWVGCQGLLAASLADGMPARRGFRPSSAPLRSPR